MSIGNITLTETRKQAFLLAPPSKPQNRKLPQDCFLSYIDQLTDGYGGSKLIRNEPRTNRDSYFILKTSQTEVRSYRRNYSHRSVALFRTKKLGPIKGNIEYLTCSFLELDGSTDGTIKNKDDVLTLASKNNLLEGLQTIGTSKGNFHLIWIYNNPLPWTTKNESYWISQQKRLIQLFEQGGFLVDKGASLNPTQNLRNPSQLNAFNFKRRCEVSIHKSYSKTSLRVIFRALNKTSIANPRRLPASVKLRRYLRANQTFEITLAELAITLGTCTKTAQRVVSRAVQNGDIQIVQRTGNNKGIARATRYTSKLYLEPNSQKGHLSISKSNSFKETNMLTDFQANGTEKGYRNKALFALGLYLKAQLGKRACIEAIRAELLEGAGACHVPEKEFERTLRNVMKNSYSNPFSISKLREWNLLEETKH